MIDRYSRSKMARIWSEQTRFQKWLDVEILAAEALARTGLVPRKAVARIKKRARFNVGRIQEIEKEVRHEVIAFLRCLGESLGEDSRFVHVGLTSSDIMDTGLALQLKEASSLLLEDVRDLLKVLRRQAFKNKRTPMIGRTHGVHAEPITFGLKFALWYEEMQRNLARLKWAADGISFGKISGAVGTFAQISPDVEAYVCRKSGLKPDPISSQIVQRDRHAFFFSTLAVVASSLEKFAVEIRHLQRTEVLEVEEPFSERQMGSSAMPHKKNPILSENVTGLARLLRSYAMASLENVALWHERDISHSSVERVIAPDATILLDFMLHRITFVLKHLSIYPETMRRNLEKSGGAIFSEKVLLRLVEKGLSRDVAYRIVQRHALKAQRDGGDFKRELLRDPEVSQHLSSSEVEEIWNIKHTLKNVDLIFQRVFR
ncbi:MAG: adenylosuccinate lyase [Deltaproteobacteria bacterium]|nr:adenylosuccinate lyase [Deltaproteobacteria bacterium]